MQSDNFSNSYKLFFFHWPRLYDVSCFDLTGVLEEIYTTAIRDKLEFLTGIRVEEVAVSFAACEGVV